MSSLLFSVAGAVLRRSLGRPAPLIPLLALPLTATAQLTPAPPTREVREILRLGDAVDVRAAHGNRLWGTGKTEMDIPYIVLYELGLTPPAPS